MSTRTGCGSSARATRSALSTWAQSGLQGRHRRATCQEREQHRSHGQPGAVWLPGEKPHQRLRQCTTSSKSIWPPSGLDSSAILRPQAAPHGGDDDALRRCGSSRRCRTSSGHENLNTTQIYTHIENTELEDRRRGKPDFPYFRRKIGRKYATSLLKSNKTAHFPRAYAENGRFCRLKSLAEFAPRTAQIKV